MICPLPIYAAISQFIVERRMVASPLAASLQFDGSRVGVSLQIGVSRVGVSLHIVDA